MLSDKQLLGRLSTLCRVGRRLDVGVVLLLIEVEDRRLDLRSAYPSLHEFCRQELGMSEGTTSRRVEAARLVRRIPKLVDHLKRGTITLSALALLKNHITETNYEDLIAKVSGMTRKKIEVVIAEMAPRPDVAAKLRKLPARSPSTSSTAAPAPGVTTPLTGHPPVATTPPPLTTPNRPAPAVSVPDASQGRLEPLAPSRWKLQLTASQELHDKLERLQTLMRHTNPSGDLALIVEAAVDRLLADLEKTRRVARERAPRPMPGPVKANAGTTKDGDVAAPTRRVVFQRDGEQCTFVDEKGRRCSATSFIQIDHIAARAKGGSGEADNLRLRCSAHNRLHAEDDFGRDYIAKRIAERTSKLEVDTSSEPPPRGSESSSLEVEDAALGVTGS